MNRIRILDCTLRDGGYVNEFCFGQSVIADIIVKLTEAHIDIIECGFLKEEETNPDKSIFATVEDIKNQIIKKDNQLRYVAMIVYGEMRCEKIPPYDQTGIDGIRLSFYKNEVEQAVLFADKLIEKGYHVLMQPVATITYSNSELIDLVSKVNQMNPYALYVVDTLGNIQLEELKRLFCIVDCYLKKTITIGFHGHENLQMSLANVKGLIEIPTKRELLFDSSVLGMGRGAGNLATESLVEYLNDRIGFRYDVNPLIEIANLYLNEIKQTNPWGYAVAYYLTAVYGCHPDYA
ncbi:MAG: aldolase catalytic domain-containing protein, partial [Oscillospiraceae bacterium]